VLICRFRRDKERDREAVAASWRTSVAHLRPGGRWITWAAPGFECAVIVSPHRTDVFVEQGASGLLVGLGLAPGGSAGAAAMSMCGGECDVGPAGVGSVAIDNMSEGICSAVFYDKESEELVASSDRTGMWGLYYAEDRSGIWLSSSSLAIGCLRSVSFDQAAFGAMRAAGYLLGDISLFNEVKRLGAGERLVVNRSGLRIERWWSPPEVRSGADLREETANFVEGVHARLRAGIGSECALTTLTAGLDSRCLLALVRGSGLAARFFTAASESLVDVELAAQVARRLGLSWFELVPKEQDAEGFRRMITLSTLLCDGENQPFRGTTYWSAALAGLSAPVLWGIGGEAWRRYWSKQESARLVLKGRTPLQRLVKHRMAAWSLPLEILASPMPRDPDDIACGLLRPDYDVFATRTVEERLEALYLSQRTRRWASCHLKTMAWWIQPELPFIGQKLVEQAYGLPMSIRDGGQIFRGAIWQCMPSAGRIPHNEGYHTLPRTEATFTDQFRAVRLESAKLLRKIYPGSSERVTHDRGGVVLTYRECFGDLLDPSRMVSRFLYRGKPLADRLEPLLDKPAGSAGMVNGILGLEIALRSATRLQT